MKNKRLILSILLTFAITFVTTSLVTLLWDLLIEKSGAVVDWKTSFLFAIIMGLVIPIVKSTESSK